MIFGRTRQIDTSIKEFERMRNVLKRAEHDPMGEHVTNPAGGSPIVGPSGSPPSGAGTDAMAPPPSASREAENSAALAAARWSELSSVVSTGSSWQGTLRVDGSVRIEGKLSGEVEAGELVFVAETAEVDAELRAATVVVAGRFQGKVQCRERLEIMPTGRVSAELTTKSLVVHDGAFVEGQVHMSMTDVAPPAAARVTDSLKEAPKDPVRERAVDRAVDALRVAAKA